MNTKTKNILLIVLGVAVIGMTVAFAALSTQLQISGTTSVPNTSWNIHFQNWDDNTEGTVTYGGNTHDNTAVFPAASALTKTLSPNITKVEGINVTLKQPGDYVSYTFEIINEGTIDASLDNFTHNLTCASGNDCSHLSYTVECVDSQNNNVLTGNPTLAKNGGLAYCTLTVTYTDQTNQNSGTAGSNQVYTQAQASATLDATWVYIQKVDSQANSGGGQQGGGTASSLGTCNDGATSFAGEVGYDGPGAQTCGNGGNSRWVAEPNPEWVAYYYNNGTAIQVCSVFGGGTVCLDGNPNGYESDFEECSEVYYQEYNGTGAACIKGYAKSKADEMISKGASCEINYNGVYCTAPNDYPQCSINSGGDVWCYDDDNNMYASCESSGNYCEDHLIE